MSAELLRDLARAKVAFQLRAIETVIRGPASVGRNPEGQDNGDWLGAEHENAVPKADAQNPSNNTYSGHDLK
jgi:hypothetical protein